MDEAIHPTGPGRSLAQRIALALLATAVGMAVVFGFLGAEWRDEARAADAAARELQLAQSLADRGGVHLASGDLLRLSTVAAVVRDAADGRVLVLDAGGKVVIDTSLALGEQRLGLLAVDGPLQRLLAAASEPPVRETAAPIRRVGETLGEVRLHSPLPERQGGFDLAAAGLALLVGLAFVVGAVVCACHWSTRVRTTTSALLRLAAGGRAGARAGDAEEREFCELTAAMRELERGMADGLQRVGEGYVAMALQLVDGLERRLLAVPGHGERTAALAQAIGVRAGLSNSELRDLELAGRLVDLGKAMIRPTVLQKTNPLTADEAESLRCHPVRAAELLECVPGLRPVAEVLGAQLERYDGKGGPEGLRAERIPLAARILAVASGFDLLTSCTERDPMPWRTALARMREERGGAFDPRIVDLLVDAVEAAPPDDARREVLLVRGGAVPWRPEPIGPAAGVDDEESAWAGEGALELVDCEPEATR